MTQKNTSIEILKPGISSVNKHDCEDHWVIGPFQEGTPDHVYQYQRICEKCGRVEAVTDEFETCTFEDVYKQFHEQ